jgi:hypothetical protein
MKSFHKPVDSTEAYRASPGKISLAMFAQLLPAGFARLLPAGFVWLLPANFIQLVPACPDTNPGGAGQ